MSYPLGLDWDGREWPASISKLAVETEAEVGRRAVVSEEAPLTTRCDVSRPIKLYAGPSGQYGDMQSHDGRRRRALAHRQQRQAEPGLYGHAIVPGPWLRNACRPGLKIHATNTLLLSKQCKVHSLSRYERKSQHGLRSFKIINLLLKYQDRPRLVS